MEGFFFQTDPEKLISWGNRATTIKRYALEAYTLRSAWVGLCVLLAFIVVCVCLCGLFTVQIRNLGS